MKLTKNLEPRAGVCRAAARVLRKGVVAAAAAGACCLAGPVLALESAAATPSLEGRGLANDTLLALDSATGAAVSSQTALVDMGEPLAHLASLSLSPAGPQDLFHPAMWSDDEWPASFAEWLETALRVIAALVAITLIGGLRRR